MTEKKIPERKEINDKHKWNLSPLFSSDTEWEKLFTDLSSKIEKYNNFRGKMQESPENLKTTLDFDMTVSRDLEKLYTYAHLKSDEDKSNQTYQGLYQRIMNLYTKISELSSFITPEIQSIPDDKISSFIENEKFKDYRFHLEKILRFKPHTHPEEIEQILAMSGEIARAPGQIFSQLDNVDMKFGTLSDEKGQSIELSHGNFNTFLINQSREVREKAFHQYYSSYDRHKHTIAETLSSSVRKDCFYSRARKFKDCRKSSLFSDNVPDSVYDTLISTVRENLNPLFNYLDFRKNALGLDRLHFYDTYVPIVKGTEFRMTYEEAVEICIKALQPLGEEYLGILKEGLLGGWVDRYENRGKRSGAYSSGCYDSPPYILLNYEENNINSLYTLIHEAGHSMHSYYSKKNQPYINADYTIFVAEVASTFNETLLSKYLLDLYSENPLMKSFILNREIDNIRATLYRQTMFAEYEHIIHKAVENSEPLTLDDLTGSYRNLLEDYFGKSMHIDEELTLEGLRIPHFYSAFYVYKYATGISAAIALADIVTGSGDAARDKYLNFLKLGGSRFPIDELLEAGVDMRTPKPVLNAIRHFASLVDMFKTEYNNL